MQSNVSASFRSQVVGVALGVNKPAGATPARAPLSPSTPPFPAAGENDCTRESTECEILDEDEKASQSKLLQTYTEGVSTNRYRWRSLSWLQIHEKNY